jgi:uncharacterized membrane-anchored protein YitT (DUF2179 family)
MKMNHLLYKILSLTTLRRKYAKGIEITPYIYAKGYRELTILTKRNFKDLILVAAGIFSAAFGFKGFLLTNEFIDGGATGISLLISNTTGVPLYMLIIGINIPFIFMGYRVVSKAFAVKTALAIVGLAICVANVEFPNVTNDNILVAIFGGFFLGTGIGLSVRGGAVIDGTEILAIFLSRKLGTTIGDIIILINIFVFSAAAYLLSIEIAMYSMITYLSASKMLDFIVEGIDEYMGVTIVSTHYAEIRQMIIEKMGRGITVYKGEKGFGTRGESEEVNILFTVITRLEMNKLNTEIQTIDPHAFVVMNSIKDTKGGMIKKKALKH